MDAHDHKTHSRPAPSRALPTNPLGHPFGVPLFIEHAPQREAMQLVSLCRGMHAVVRILANSDLFRDIQINCADVEPGYWPLDADLTQGLFAALHVMSEQADTLTQLE